MRRCCEILELHVVASGRIHGPSFVLLRVMQMYKAAKRRPKVGVPTSLRYVALGERLPARIHVVLGRPYHHRLMGTSNKLTSPLGLVTLQVVRQVWLRCFIPTCVPRALFEVRGPPRPSPRTMIIESLISGQTASKVDRPPFLEPYASRCLTQYRSPHRSVGSRSPLSFAVVSALGLS